MNRLKKSYKLIIAIIVVIVLVILPKINPDNYMIYNITSMFIWSVMALGLYLNLKAHIFNFAPAGLMLVGAYISGMLITKMGISFWLTIPIAIVGAVAFSLFIGIIAFRTKGLYFVLITASFSIALVLLVALLANYTGGWGGLPTIPPPQFFGIDFSDKTAFYWLALAFLIIMFLFCYRLWNSRIGRVYEFMGENDSLAQSVGVPLLKTRLQNFAISGVLFALAGCFYGEWTNHIDPTMFHFDANMEPWFFIVMGGSGSLVGPIVGTVIVKYLRVLFSFADQAQPIAIGVAVILIILFLPKGLISIPEKVMAVVKKAQAKSRG